MPSPNSLTPFSLIAREIAPDLRRGEVGILPTDTLYGIVGSALNARTVRKIYSLRRRNPTKPMIVLIADLRDLARFGITPARAAHAIVKRVWPGKVSVVLPIGNSAAKKFKYLHRGTNTLAFRLPRPAWLRSLLKKTGPLVAPSANFEGKPPARTVAEAKKYFGDKVKFYVDFGRVASKPSTLIAINGGEVKVLRKGAVKIH
ncbi:MAG TPA: L-threonylcarbamoyladenylate synthase [Candidatus Paceibacterota bacterium]|jgi:L-threonylcarbamoyladenylate synthase|nr:L-threonylcarbamoyladenylate synthase [Candidatus Paceibacterota bacterium]